MEDVGVQVFVSSFVCVLASALASTLAFTLVSTLNEVTNCKTTRNFTSLIVWSHEVLSFFWCLFSHVSTQVRYKLQQRSLYLSQCPTKPTIRPVRPAKTQIIHAVWSESSLIACLLLPPGYPKRDKRESLPHGMDVQADLSLCWLNRSYCRFCRAPAHF